MILLDSDIMIDLLRQYPPAIRWLNRLDADEPVVLPGYVVMELTQGCRNRDEIQQVQRAISTCAIVWPSPSECDQALELFITYRLSHQIGLLDVMIAQTALSLDVPLFSFNQKHYQCIPGLKTIQPYEK